MKPALLSILAMLVTLLTVAVLSGCADKPGPPPGAPPATINQQQNSQQTPPTYGQTREEQKEGQ
ncbi:MAG: hypothetical protein RMM08_12820 [Armatimonadota bacterium]|nr:hypothetical protein [bacterium]MDW8322234.1 hypothetical protein [Armatimonadota bacterium]